VIAIPTPLLRKSRAVGESAVSHSFWPAAASGRVSAAISEIAVVRKWTSSLGPQASSRRPPVAIMPQTTRKTAPTIGRGISTSSVPVLGESP